MKFFPIALIILFVGCAEHTSSDQLIRIPYQSDATGMERDFFVYLPKGYEEAIENLPVLLFLHGNGERGDGKEELDYVKIHGPLYEVWTQKRDLPFIMIVPQLPMFGMDSLADYIRNRTRDQIPERLEAGVPARPNSFPTNEIMSGDPPDTLFDVGAEGLPAGWPLIEDELLWMIDYVLKTYKADASRMYLTGLSYGGFGSWYMASKNPERFAAVAPVVGWGHPDLMHSIAQNQIPVWAFAGGRDPVVRAKYFYPGINKLESLGLKELRFTVHEDMGHDAWTTVYGGDDLYNWMLQFSTKP
ncbi:MAG: putative peptidase [Cyclobacteriaceae bacterium]|jgi:predicted peptidase